MSDGLPIWKESQDRCQNYDHALTAPRTALTRAEKGKRLDLFRGRVVHDERVRVSVRGCMPGESHR